MKRPGPYICIVAMCLAGCSIKADRTLCPCLLDLAIPGGDERLVQVCTESHGSFNAVRVELDDSSRCRLEVPERSAELKVSAVSGLHSCHLHNGVLLVSEGCEMDEIYASSTVLDTGCDHLEGCLPLHRQFAFAYILLDDAPNADFPYEMEVSGNVCGMDAFTLEPVAGAFSVRIRPFIRQYHRICLPRQADDSLKLLFYEKGQTRSSSDGPELSVPLGAIISASGYDWTSSDLEDIYVDVSLTEGSLSVNVLPWKRIII
ncbi:MAG: hypothetical protein KBS55_02135 [Bacteroidales bacterium]|nr:hypothetical protein [Candidatus Cryptobacteroides aphodequi]